MLNGGYLAHILVYIYQLGISSLAFLLPKQSDTIANKEEKYDIE